MCVFILLDEILIIFFFNRWHFSTQAYFKIKHVNPKHMHKMLLASQQCSKSCTTKRSISRSACGIAAFVKLGVIEHFTRGTADEPSFNVLCRKMVTHAHSSQTRGW